MSVHYADGLAGEFVPAETLHQHPRNPNNGDVETIISSLKANGCYRPIYASRASGYILAGHHLYTGLLTLGEERVPVQWLENLTPEQELQILLVDNKAADLGWIDDALVLDILDDIGVHGTGYTEDEMLEMKAELATGFGGGKQELEDEDEEDLTFKRPVTCPHCSHEFTIDSELI